MENRAHALAAGAFTLLLLVAAVASILWFGGTREATTDYLVVTQQNVSGLSLQGQVRYRGIRVGRVESIALDERQPRDILIRISVDSDVPITRGTIAKLGYQGLTGIAHVLLEDAGSDPSPLGGTDGLPRIRMQPSLLQELSDSGGAVLREAHVLLANLNALLTPENRKHVAQTLANLEAGSAGLTSTLAEARTLLADPRVKRLGPAIARFETAADSARAALDDVRGLVPKLAALTAQAERVLGGTNGDEVAAAGERLRELGRELTLTSRQLARALRMIEDEPQSLLFGASPPPPGPGEPGHSFPATGPRP